MYTSITVLPIAAVRQGRGDAEREAVARRISRRPGSAWFGRPSADADALGASASPGPSWFVVAVDADDRPVAVAYYSADRARAIPSIRITSVAADPALDERTRVAVAAAVVEAAADRFFRDSAGVGYVVIDVDQTATEVADVLRTTGWRCLQPRAGWPTDRFVRFR